LPTFSNGKAPTVQCAEELHILTAENETEYIFTFIELHSKGKIKCSHNLYIDYIEHVLQRREHKQQTERTSWMRSLLQTNNIYNNHTIPMHCLQLK